VGCLAAAPHTGCPGSVRCARARGPIGDRPERFPPDELPGSSRTEVEKLPSLLSLDARRCAAFLDGDVSSPSRCP